jgi:hypothetical protein
VIARIDCTAVTHVTAYSPYFDGGSAAVRRVLQAFPHAKTVRVVMDPSSGSMEPTTRTSRPASPTS